MNNLVLAAAVEICKHLDETRGLAYSHEFVLKAGIQEIAKLCGTELENPVLYGTGEFFIVGVKQPNGGCKPYGEQFAALFDGIKRRTGRIEYGYYDGKMHGHEGWCYVPYGEVEKMIRKAAVCTL